MAPNLQQKQPQKHSLNLFITRENQMATDTPIDYVYASVYGFIRGIEKITRK
jgi:hypothetical protein